MLSLAMLLLLSLLLPPLADGPATASGTHAPGPLSQDQPYRMLVDSEDADKGFTLIAPFKGYRVLLLDYQGTVVHTWRSDRMTMGTVLLLENGTLLRGRSGTSGQPAGLHLLDWDGTVLWDYTPPPSMFEWHHDIEPLPNGNILINAEVTYNQGQAIAMGRAPAISPGPLAVGAMVEIRPNGTKGGDIVWMWDPADHLVQDYDPEKANYGVVRDHPELVDINYPWMNTSDWQHSNAVAYNAELDQVMITNVYLSEVWVVDHNTTTEEAAGHTGGARGKGGDLLYRWGNPQAYDSGNSSQRVLYSCHDGHWVRPGMPGAGNIIVFNNGVVGALSRPEGRWSSVDEFAPPLNATGGYDLVPGSAWGPSRPDRRFTASPATDCLAIAMGGAERLPDGNTLVCGGSSGYNFEVDPENEVVWEYKSSSMFTVHRYYPPAIDLGQVLSATEDVPMRVDISPFLSDPDTDHEDLAIGASSIYASIQGHELLLQYTDEIVTDAFNLSVSDGIFKVQRTVRVNVTPVNDPPILAPLAGISTTEDLPYVLDLRPYVSDPDTDIELMNITVGSSYVTVDGSTLTFLYPEGVLNDSVLLSVSDGEFVDSAVILVSVRPVDDPPTVDRIPDQSGIEDVPWTVDLGKYVHDVDTPVEYVSIGTDSRYATVSGLVLTLLYPDGVVRDVVTLTASDGKGATAAGFNVSVRPVNDPPVIGEVPPLTVREDEPFYLDLGPLISDVDTDTGDLTLKAGSPFVTVEGLVLVLLYPEGVLHDVVAVELWDGDLRVSATLVVDVEPVNDPPAIGDIPPLDLREDEPFSLDLAALISDPDTPKQGLTLVVDSPFVTVEGHALRLLYPDGVLHDEVVVGLWDGFLNASTVLVIDVEPVNDPPWWAAVPDLIAVEDVEDQRFLDPYMNDIDTPFAQLVVGVSSSYGWLEGRIFRFFYPEGVLGETVTLTLSDGESQAVVRLNVTVTPVNDAPELSGASVQAPRSGAGASYRLTVVFKDVDMGPDAPTVEAVIDGKTYSCARDALSTGPYIEGVVFFLETDLSPGKHTVSFTAYDGDGGKATTETALVTAEGTPSRTGATTIIASMLIIGAVVLVAVLLRRRSRLS